MRTLISLAVLVTCTMGATGYVSAIEDEQAELQSAIASIRGVEFQDLDETQSKELSEKLDAAWDVFLERPKQAKILIREALDKESDDHFFILDLSYLYLGLDPKPTDLEEVSNWVVKADPAAYPQTYFDLASGMASLRCESCHLVVLKMLELEELNASIPQHALTVDLWMGLLFTVVPYGEEIVPEVVVRLSSSNCVVRANAALAIGLLLPFEYPAAIVRMAESDSCERARADALRSLAMADPPALVRVLDQRMETDPAPGSTELLVFVEVLILAQSPLSIPRLEELSKHTVPTVVAEAQSALEVLRENGGSEPPPRLFNSGDAQARSRLIRHLTKAKKKSRFEYEGSPSEMISVLTRKDYAILNEARQSVLRRLSDECLYEFHTLHSATLRFRDAIRAIEKKQN